MPKLLSLSLVAFFLSTTLDVRLQATTLNVPGHYATVQACVNAAQPGDTCLVAAGTYNEVVETVRAGTAGNYITIKAVNNAALTTTAAADRSQIKHFRIRHAYIRLENFAVSKYAAGVGSNQAHVRVEPAADNCQIVNTLIHRGVYKTASDWSFDASAKTITSPSGGLLTAGFAAGALIYIGSDINNPIRNHDNNRLANPSYAYENKTISTVTDTVITLVGGNTLFTEGPVQSTIYVSGAEKVGIWGILFIESSATGVADNCLIQGNRLSDLAGRNLDIKGNNHLVENNTFELMNGWRPFSFNSTNNTTFRRNVFKNSPRWPGFNLPCCGHVFGEEGSWDMYDALFASQNSISRNNIIEENFFDNIDSQFGNVEERGGGSGLIIRMNIFVRYELTHSLSRPGTLVHNNTFYNTAWNGNSAHAFILSKSSISGNPVGSDIRNNAFIANAVATDATRGWYSTIGYDGVHTTGVTADYNFVAGAAPGFASKSGFRNNGLEAHGVNGGNPTVINLASSFGADGIPFTTDDGLKPQAGSPLCGAGEGGVDIGAYSCDPTKVFAAGPAVPSAPTNFRISR